MEINFCENRLKDGELIFGAMPRIIFYYPNQKDELLKHISSVLDSSHKKGITAITFSSTELYDEVLDGEVLFEPIKPVTEVKDM